MSITIYINYYFIQNTIFIETMALDCPVCFKEYLHNEESTPRIVLCGHTFCFPCIFKLKRLKKDSRGTQIQLITCPLCRKESDFDKNTMNVVVIQMIKEKKA